MARTQKVQYLKIFILWYITVLLPGTCTSDVQSDTRSYTLLCPRNVSSFSIGPRETQYYKCEGEGKVPVLQSCPDNEYYWPAKEKCTTMSTSLRRTRRNANAPTGNSDLETFTTPVLGRPVQLGCMYDARKDQILDAESFWDINTVRNKKVKSNTYSQDADFVAIKTTSDKLNLMDVKVALRLSFMAGLIKVSGSASYLRDKLNSEHTVAVVMNARYTTRTEMLPVQTPLTYIKLCGQKKGPTHVVTNILYGMDANFVFKRTVRRDQSTQDVAGNLKVVVKSLPGIQIEGEGSVKINDTFRKSVSDINVKLYGDFVLDKQPTTYIESIKVFKELSSHLGVKPDYKYSAPMKMTLTPITRFCGAKEAILNIISNTLLRELVKMLDEIERTELRLKTLLSSDSVKNYLPLKNILNRFMNKLGTFKLTVQGELQILLPKIRGGGAGSGEADLVQMLTKYSTSPFFFQTAESFLDVRRREIEMIDFILNPKAFKGTEVKRLDFKHSTDNKMVFTKLYVTMLKFNILPSTDVVDRFLKNNIVDESNSWFNKLEVVSEMGRKFKDFMKFANANRGTNNRGFLLALSDAKATFSNVYAQRKGIIVSTDFEIPTAPPQLQYTSNMFDMISFNIQKPRNKFINSFTITYFKIAREESVVEISFPFSLTNVITAKITGLIPNEFYVFSMSYVTVMGRSPSSPESEPIATRPSSPPANLRTKNVMSTSFGLEWDVPSHIGSGVVIGAYEVITRGQNFLKTDQVASDKRTTTITGISPASLFTVSVVAVVNKRKLNAPKVQPKGTFGRSLPTNIDVTSAPNPPDVPNLVAVAFRSATIEWNKPVKVADAATINDYMVKYVQMDNLGKKKGTDVSRSTQGQTSINLKDLVQGTTYGVSVKVVTSHGESAYSSTLIIKTKFKQTELDKLRDSVNAQITSVATREIQGVRRDMNNQINGVSNRITRNQNSITGIRRDLNNQINGITNRITRNQNSITAIRDDVKLLSPESLRCRVASPVYYPKNTKQHRFQRCYVFDGNRKAEFVGYGYPNRRQGLATKSGVTFDQCRTWCYDEKVKPDNTWNGFVWHSNNYCECYKIASGFNGNHNYVYYKFIT